MDLNPSLGLLLRLCSMAALSLAILAPGARADQQFAGFDRALAAAVREKGPAQVPPMLAAAEHQLEVINAQRSAKGGVDIEVNARAELIDQLRAVVAFEAQQDFLESVRLQVRALDLARTLWEASDKGQAERSRDLDALVHAQYERLLASGANDWKAEVAYTPAKGETLVFRVFAETKEGLSAFELVASPNVRKVSWREKPLARSASGLLAKAAAIYGASNDVKVPFSATAYPFLLVVADAAEGEEARLATSLRVLPAKGIVPLVLESTHRSSPIVELPAIPATPEVKAGLRGNAAALYHRVSGALIWSWDSLSSRNVDKVGKLAGELATEVPADLGLAQAETAPTGELEAVLPRLDVVTSPQAAGESKAAKPAVPLKAVLDVTEAARVDTRGKLSLGPETPLRLAARLLGTDWQQYAIVEKTGEMGPAIWLRSKQVSDYVPPLQPAPSEPKATEGGATPGAHDPGVGKVHQPPAATKAEQPPRLKPAVGQ